MLKETVRYQSSVYDGINAILFYDMACPLELQPSSKKFGDNQEVPVIK
jgi:hypothetical protein